MNLGDWALEPEELPIFTCHVCGEEWEYQFEEEFGVCLNSLCAGSEQEEEGA